MSDDPESADYTIEDRIKAAEAAGRVLRVSSGFATSEPPDLYDLLVLAGWMLTGDVMLVDEALEGFFPDREPVRIGDIIRPRRGRMETHWLPGDDPRDDDPPHPQEDEDART